MAPNTEWFEYCRTHSPRIRALQGRERRLREVLDCDNCQTPEGYSPCPAHPENFVATEE